MTQNILFNILFKDNNIFAQFNQINEQIDAVNKSVNNMDSSISNSFNNMKGYIKNINIESIASQVERVGKAFGMLANPGIEFEKSVAELSAITGIAGDDLTMLADNARKVGKDSGLGAARAVSAYKVLASQIDVSKIGMQGLNELQDKTVVLAKASGMGIEEASNSLAGTINQFGMSAEEANRVINVLAAGSKYGAAEIPELAQSFKVVGAAANAAGLDIEQTAGAIEVLSKNNLKGAEAGTALRNIILKMQTQLGVDFGETSLSQALTDLNPKLNDATYLSKLFGMENIAAAQFLISNAGAVDEMTEKVTGSNVAQEQAAIIGDTMADKMDKIRANVEDLGIGMFDLTGGTIGYLGVVGEMAGGIANLVPIMMMLGSIITFVTNAQKMQALWTGIVKVATWLWTGAQWALNAAFWANPLTWIIALVVGLIAVIVWAAMKTEGWGKQWDSIVNFMKYTFMAYVDSVKLYFTTLINGIMIGLDYLKLGWYKFKEAVGIGDSDENANAIANINADIEARQKAIVDGAKKVAENLKKAKDSLKWEIKIKDTSLEDVSSDLQKQLTGGNTVIPVATATETNNNESKTTNNEMKKTSQTISQGGSRSTEININLDNMVENIVFNGSMNENKDEVMKRLEEMFIRLVLMSRGVAAV